MDKTTETSDLEKKLDDVLAILLHKSAGSRVTLRIDDAARGWNVDFICAEAVRSEIKSLRGDGSINQRDAATVKWMAANKRNLIQPDIVNNPDPAPPPALIGVYAAKAQMLSPLLSADGYLRGWISVHYVEGAHPFTDDEVRALEEARAEVMGLSGIGSPRHRAA
jgi:GAF domain-containing protein